MKKFCGLFAISLILALVQQAFLGELLGVRYTPHLVFAWVFALFASAQIETALFSGVIGGVLIDLLGVDFVGLSPVFCVGYLLLIAYIKRRFFRGIIVNVVAFILFSCFYDILSNSAVVTVAFGAILGRAFLGLGCCGIFYLFIRKFLNEKYSL